MASDVTHGGFDYNYGDIVDEELICPICTLVARDPHQANCCGNLYCKSCLQQLMKRRNFTCPTCRADLTDNYFFDRRANRKIKSLQVYCNNKNGGCQWKGDLKDIEDHLQECPYQLVSCSNDCGMRDLQQRHLQNHLKNDCPKRLIKCQYCNEEGRHQVMTGDHLGVCPEYPTRCTNEGCSKKVPRHLMPSHKELCPKEMISCGYRSVGCEEKMKREEQEEHNEQWREQHLQLAVGEVNKLHSDIIVLNSTITDLQKEHKLAVKELNDKLQITENIVKAIVTSNGGLHINNVIKFSDFASNKRDDTRWFSLGFYTSPGGYKMCLCVYANGVGEDTHVSCYIRLMSGEYDDVLEWPFHGEVTIELLNQLEDKNHHKRVLPFNESTPQHINRRVFERECAEYGWGSSQFISHSQLDVNPWLNRQYLTDDTLYFRVSVKVTSNTKPWLVA